MTAKPVVCGECVAWCAICDTCVCVDSCDAVVRSGDKAQPRAHHTTFRNAPDPIVTDREMEGNRKKEKKKGKRRPWSGDTKSQKNGVVQKRMKPKKKKWIRTFCGTFLKTAFSHVRGSLV